jgi:glycerate 2-kinase
MERDPQKRNAILKRRTTNQLREDALAIWRAGVESVLGDRLVKSFIRTEEGQLWLGDQWVDLAEFDRLVVVGGGKAAASMALGFEEALSPWTDQLEHQGWLNIPAGCLRPTEWIHLHEARPAGRNEPTAQGAEGTSVMLEWVENLGPRDWCVVLLSGGGSALLPAPIEGISLDDKLATTRFLSGAGANIEQLNTVRKSLSRIKGGGLARACRAGRLDTLIISDVLGDPLDIIASGPTVPNSTGAREALAILKELAPERKQLPSNVYQVLESELRHEANNRTPQGPSVIHQHIIGNLAVAVDAAGVEAEKRGYSHAMQCARSMEGTAESVGELHAQLAWRMRHETGPDCLITGGEPVVKLAPPEIRGKGGRNQQLVLAAFQELRRLRDNRAPESALATEGICLLSGGTDGEDGPTTAAGGWVDTEVEAAIISGGLDVMTALARNDAYPLLDRCSSLLETGPTHTNVCDLRVVVVDRIEASASTTSQDAG